MIDFVPELVPLIDTPRLKVCMMIHLRSSCKKFNTTYTMQCMVLPRTLSLGIGQCPIAVFVDII